MLLGWFFWLFNRTIKLSTRVYIGIVARMLRVSVLVLVVYGGLIVLTYWGYLQLPTGFIPTQDKGYLVASVQLPGRGVGGADSQCHQEAGADFPGNARH